MDLKELKSAYEDACEHDMLTQQLCDAIDALLKTAEES